MTVTANLSHAIASAVYPPLTWGSYMTRAMALSDKALAAGLVRESLYWATVCSELTLWPKAALEETPIAGTIWNELERDEAFVDSFSNLPKPSLN